MIKSDRLSTLKYSVLIPHKSKIRLISNQNVSLPEEERSKLKKRGTAMFQNIYNYSKGHSYDKAIFTVGAAHRKSLMQKIHEYEMNLQIELDILWKVKLYQNKPTQVSHLFIRTK